MTKGRLEAFSDGVIAILITIMVLELHAPHGTDWAALAPLAPEFFTYALSFVFLGIYVMLLSGSRTTCCWARFCASRVRGPRSPRRSAAT